jgi:hypothetical protein
MSLISCGRSYGVCAATLSSCGSEAPFNGDRRSRLCRPTPVCRGEELPASAPELNPVEQIGNDFTGHTANSLLQSTWHLYRSLQAINRRVRGSQEKLCSFILASKLPSPP